jgi:subtilisin family serine protease
MKRFLTYTLLLFLFFLGGFPSQAVAKDEPGFVKDELLVQPKAWASKASAQEAFQEHGVQVVGQIHQVRVKRIRVPEHALDKVKDALLKSGRFSFVEKHGKGRGMYIPDDGSYDSQWHLPKIEAPSGWDMNSGSSSEPIAIIDSGVDPDHPDLAEKIIPGKNFLDGSSDTADVLGHGTKVAGSAAAIGDNEIGVAGLAWSNPIMPLVVLSSDNWAYYSHIASAITHAVDKGVRVINISIAGSSSSLTLQNAVDYAWSKGAVIVASAANSSTSTPYYPAACEHVVAVGATDSSDQLASFSNYGNWVDLCAPGTSILSTKNGGSYGSSHGTSFSSPITAGVAALMFSEKPGLTNSELVSLLTSSTDDLGDPGFDSVYGNGRVNAYEAVLAAAGLGEPVSSPTNLRVHQ